MGSSIFVFSSGVWTPGRPSIPKDLVLVLFLGDLWARRDARHISASRLRFFLASIIVHLLSVSTKQEYPPIWVHNSAI